MGGDDFAREVLWGREGEKSMIRSRERGRFRLKRNYRNYKEEDQVPMDDT